MRKGWPIALALLACGPRGHWPPRPAEHPPTRAELAAYELTVRGEPPPERNALAAALAARGFDVVSHDPRKGQLEVTLTQEAQTRVATLRSDGWFVDEALGTDVAGLAQTLSVSQRVADFIRNSGLPQQQVVPEN
jgi:hypothetical protein